MQKNFDFQYKYTNMAQPRVGAKIISVTDDFFAPCERMLDPKPAVFISDKYDKNGKWMDGWESRRKRVEGNDHCVVQLGHKSIIHGVDIDTSHFKGNHPSAASIDACLSENGVIDDDTTWVNILPVVDLNQDSPHLFEVLDNHVFSHIRLNIFPDGGVARLRVYAEPACFWQEKDPTIELDLFSVENGGRALVASHQGFGSSMLNLNLPGSGINMGDGWETARRRTPGNEWVIIQLGHPGKINSIDIDTAFYKGNFPDQISIQAGYCENNNLKSIENQSLFWPTILQNQKLSMDCIQRFDKELDTQKTISHLRVNIHPDGGISRIRVNGFFDPDIK